MYDAGGKTAFYLWWWVCLILISFLGGSCRYLPRYLSVCEVQGEELESPFLGQEVILSGLVSGAQDKLDPGGVMIVDENCPLNGAESRGIFVQLAEGQDLLDQGDEIWVQGWVREIGGETRLEANPGSLEILSLNNPISEPVDLGQYLVPPLLFGYEKWEGQLVNLPRVDLQIDSHDTGRDQIFPRLSAGSSNQLVCFRAKSFSLGISWDLSERPPERLDPGSQLTDLTGWIRQDGEGYYLLLKDKPGIVYPDRDTAAAEEAPELPVGLPGTAPGVTPIPIDNPSPTASHTVSPQPSSSPIIVPTPTYYQVRLLISEVFPNPAGDEPGGEWIELYNPQRGWLLLNGIKIGDETSPTGSEGLLRFPDGYYLEGGKTLVIANQARVFETAYGFLPDFELENSHPLVPDLHPYYRWGRSDIKLANSGDEVLLLDPWDKVVDLVAYGKGSAESFSPPADAPQEGHSLERYPPDADQDLASDWREQSDPSPGQLDRSTPTPPAAPTVPIPPSPSLSPSFEVPSVTSSLTATIQLTSLNPDLSATPDLSTTPTSTKTVEATVLVPTPSPPGAPSPTMALTSPADTSTPLPQPTSPEGGATPSLEPTSAGASLLINEILADPDPLLGDSNRDGQVSHDDDEFVELANISGGVLDVSGWQVYDGIRLRFTFPEGVRIAPGCGLVIFGGGTPPGGFGGSLVFTAGSLGLNNGGDLVSIRDGNGQVRTQISYGSEGGQDQSLTRDPDLSLLSALVLHGGAGDSGGAPFSPGTRVDGSAFGACP